MVPPGTTGDAFVSGVSTAGIGGVSGPLAEVLRTRQSDTPVPIAWDIELVYG
jgi:hypothetical protein